MLAAGIISSELAREALKIQKGILLFFTVFKSYLFIHNCPGQKGKDRGSVSNQPSITTCSPVPDDWSVSQKPS